jgi:hypothetical protein
MASETAAGSSIEIVREYTERVFNQHSPDLAAKYLAPGVTWHGQILGGQSRASITSPGCCEASSVRCPTCTRRSRTSWRQATQSLCATSSRRCTRGISWGSPRPVAGCAGTPWTSTAWPAG